MGITRVGCSLDDDYPVVDWSCHASMADLWLEIDDRYRAGEPFDNLLSQISYQLELNCRWPRVDCIAMVPGLAVSSRSKVVLENMGISGMQFLEFQVNGESFFMFLTARRVDCLDRERSELEFFRSSPEHVKEVVRYVFIEERLSPCDVFTVPELSDGMFPWAQEIFFTALARNTIEKAGLIGFHFKELPA